MWKIEYMVIEFTVVFLLSYLWLGEVYLLKCSSQKHARSYFLFVCLFFFLPDHVSALKAC